MIETKESHSIANAKATIETMVEDFKKDQLFEKSNDYNQQNELRESILNSPLSVQFRSGWHSSVDDDIVPEEFKILLSTGGPACQIIGKLDQYKQPTDIEIQYQDWGTPWEPLQLNSTYADKSPNITSDYQALEWFCNCFYFGE